MKRNFNTPLKGFGGIPITEKVKNSDGSVSEKPLNVASQLGARLFYAGSEQQGNRGGEQLSDDDKLRCYRISVQLSEHPSDVELTVEDCALVKRIASREFVAGVYGQIVDIIENG